MKTININLIGELNQAPEYNKTVIKKDNLDAGAKIFVVVFLVGVFVIFIASFATWLVMSGLCAKNKPVFSKLKAEHQELKKEETKLSAYQKNLQKDLAVAKFKLFAKDQVDNTFIPWSLVLRDLATRIPKNIVVLDIDKTSAGRTGGSNELRITGLVPAGKNKKPITAISFFILNINEGKDSLLSNAQIGRLEYKDETNIYEFEIKAKVVKP